MSPTLIDGRRTIGFWMVPILSGPYRASLMWKTDIRSFGQRRQVLKLKPVCCERAHFPGRHGVNGSYRLVRWRSQALKPRQRHAEGVWLDGNEQRQAIISAPTGADLIPHCQTGRVPSFTAYATIVLAAVLGWPILKNRLPILIATPPRWNWFGAHLVSLIASVGWSAIGRGGPSTYWTSGIWIRVALEMTTLATWFAALLPPSFWLVWIRRAPEAFVTAGVFALMAKLLNHLIASPWEINRAATFKMVGGILAALGQTVSLSPSISELGIHGFGVRILPSCSGLDGIAVTFGLLSL
jgi:hypothetical protein